MAIVAAFMVPHPPMVVPAVGKGGENVVHKTINSYDKVAKEIAELQPETIIITSPHSIMYTDYFHISPGKGARGSFGNFRAPEITFDEEYDEKLRDRICDICEDEDFPAGVLGERDRELDHGTMVPLWFIRKHYKGGKIIRVGLSGLGLLDHYRMGEIIQQAVDETGTILPTTDCVAMEVIQNAISASTRDNRFNPISPEELPDLEINVDVLNEPEDISSPDELDVKRYGVIVSSGHRRGLLLPDLEGVDSVAQQISIARQKGGIGENEPIKLQRFEVIRHK